jgi:Family of unknown function (DUF6334)
MTSPRIAAAEALLPILSPFGEIGCVPLKAVRESYVFEMVSRLAFDFGHATLLIEAIADDDTVAISTSIPSTAEEGATDVSGREPWRDLIAKEFGWGWVTINQQGYLDGVLLSFRVLRRRSRSASWHPS